MSCLLVCLWPPLLLPSSLRKTSSPEYSFLLSCSGATYAQRAFLRHVRTILTSYFKVHVLVSTEVSVLRFRAMCQVRSSKSPHKAELTRATSSMAGEEVNTCTSILCSTKGPLTYRSRSDIDPGRLVQVLAFASYSSTKPLSSKCRYQVMQSKNR